MSTEIIIDHPKGFKKVFNTKSGPVEQAYPVDYGFVLGLGKNPQDGEEPDVFVGTAGDVGICGRFMKGRPSSDGGWDPDEYKWFIGLTGEEYARLYAWWHGEHDEGCTWDWKTFGSKEEAWEDMRKNSGS